MSGFGKKRKENIGSSKKLLTLSEQDLKQESINNHLKGNRNNAEKGYITFLKKGFKDADIYSNYALICEEKGETSKAIKLYKKCISDFPHHIFSKLNLSFLYYKSNDLKEAELLVEEAIKLNPGLPNGYCIKGLILKNLNQFNESKKALQIAIDLDKNYFDAYLNLGLLYKEYNKFHEAEEYYLKAIQLRSSSAIAHLNLGACYREKKQLDKARYHTEIAIKIDSKLQNSYINLATIYKEKGDYIKSITYAKKELNLNQNNELIYQMISELLKESELLDFSEKGNRKLLLEILNQKNVSHRELFGSINNIVSNQLLEKVSNLKYNLFENKEFNILIQYKEIIKALSLLVFCSPLWEKTLISIRKNMLINYSEYRKINQNVINFTIALGSQCFLNEYVYYISEPEKHKLKELKESIKNNKNQDYKLALISCYQSLFSINNLIINFKNYKSSNKEFNKLIDLQFRDKIIEQEISKEIIKTGKIEDLVSKKVKDQYESNPYPRWRYNSYVTENKVNIVSAINSEIYPNSINSDQIELTNKKLNILIAGCGTGIQILEASRYSNCEITAIDLSNSSISYAKRKVDEYGMKNINFIEMDLLDLKTLNKRFDLIECSGVIHHMKDPAKALYDLTEALEINGFLKLGLYSKYARKEILKARKLIKEKDIRPNLDEMRSFRNDIFNGDIRGLDEITKWSDFYSTSMCRDLCFHSQEKCFSLIEIKDMIEKNNLEFLGFTLLKDLKDKYQINHKDLKLWDKFEQKNPNSFREMYQFWTRKSIK